MMKTLAIPARLQKENLTDAEKAELATFGDQPMSPAEIAARQKEEALAIPALVMSDLKDNAAEALDQTDMTALRCVKANIPFPDEWQDYVTNLRAVITSGVGPLPVRPAYPEGT